MKKSIIALLPLLLALAGPAAAQDTNDYALRSDLSAYAERSELDAYVTHDTLSDYTQNTDLSAYATLADLVGFVSSSSLTNYALLSDLPAEISAWLATNPPAVSPSILTNYALRSDLAAYAPLSALAGFLTTEDLADYALTSDLTAYATASDLADYATASDLAAAVSNTLAAVSNSFLGAYSSTSGSNTYWHVPLWTWFDEPTYFYNGFDVQSSGHFYDEAVFDDAITFGGETRTNFPGPRELYLGGGDSAWITLDDGLVWTYPDESDVLIYLPSVTNAAGRAVTVVVRNISDDDSVVTRVYDGTRTPPVLYHTLTPTNPIAVFDWCTSCDGWMIR